MAVDLRRMRFLINREPAARFRVERAMARATKTTAALSGMPRGGGVGNPVERGASDLEDARAALDAIRAELNKMRAVLRPMIAELEIPLQRLAMEMRYIDGYSVRELSYRLNYSEQHLFRVLSKAESEISAKDESNES